MYVRTGKLGTWYAGELAGPGEGCRGGQARTPSRMGAIHGCHAATSVGAGGPFFFKLVEPLPVNFFPILPLG